MEQLDWFFQVNGIGCGRIRVSKKEKVCLMGDFRVRVQKLSKVLCLVIVWFFQVFQKVFLSFFVRGQLLRICLLQVVLGLYRIDVFFFGLYGCFLSVVRLVYLWVCEVVVWCSLLILFRGQKLVCGQGQGQFCSQGQGQFLDKISFVVSVRGWFWLGLELVRVSVGVGLWLRLWLV